MVTEKCQLTIIHLLKCCNIYDFFLDQNGYLIFTSWKWARMAFKKRFLMRKMCAGILSFGLYNAPLRFKRVKNILPSIQYCLIRLNDITIFRYILQQNVKLFWIFLSRWFSWILSTLFTWNKVVGAGTSVSFGFPGIYTIHIFMYCHYYG